MKLFVPATILLGVNGKAKKQKVSGNKVRNNNYFSDVWPKNLPECSQDDVSLTIDSNKRSGTLSSNGDSNGDYENDIGCQITVETGCNNLAVRFTKFQVENSSDGCDFDYVQLGTPGRSVSDVICGLDNSHIVDYDAHYEAVSTWNDNLSEEDEHLWQYYYYDSYFEESSYTDRYPVSFFQWTPLESNTLLLAFQTDDSVYYKGWNLEFQCVEDLLNIPTCNAVPTAFGQVTFEETEKTAYSSGSKFTVKSDASEENCAKECFEVAGCSHFYYSSSDGCQFIIGPAKPEDNTSITSSGALRNLCPENPFVGQFNKVSEFFCKFQTALETKALINQILVANDASDLPLNEWVFETSNDGTFESTTRIVNLSEEYPDGVEPANGEAAWTYIKFSIITYVRTGISNARSAGNFQSALDGLASINDDLVNALQSSLELPEEAALLETTEVVEVTQVVTNEGEVAGTCNNGNCSCSDGFIQQPDGSCVPPEPTLPVIETDFDEDSTVAPDTTATPVEEVTVVSDAMAAEQLEGLQTEFTTRMSDTFGAGSNFYRTTRNIVDNISSRLNRGIDRFSCEGTRSISNKVRSQNVCDDLQNLVDDIQAWMTDRIPKCGANPHVRDQLLDSQGNRLGRLSEFLDDKCEKKLRRKLNGKNV